MELFSLTGKTALVVGASSGIGESFAKDLAKAGAKVLLAARRKNNLQAIAKEIIGSGGKAEILELDITNNADIQGKIKSLFIANKVDILVNCAGVASRKLFLEFPESEWDHIMNVNLKGLWLVSLAVAKEMIHHHIHGSIINVSSILGSRARKNSFAYATSKAGVEHLTRNMALNLVEHNIRVNAIAPGWFYTELTKDLFDSEVGASIRATIPYKRIGELSELSGALLLLASDASNYMTGSVIHIDGGYSCLAI